MQKKKALFNQPTLLRGRQEMRYGRIIVALSCKEQTSMKRE